MAPRDDTLHLGAFLYPGSHHVAVWRHPDFQGRCGIDAARLAAVGMPSRAGFVPDARPDVTRP
jgi:hypothetical protein